MGELRSPAAVHSLPAEGDSLPAAEEGRRIHLAAAGEGSLAVDRNRLAAGHSLKDHQEEGQTGSGHRNRPAEEERRIQERRLEGGLTSRPWCRTRDQLLRESA